MSHRNHVSLGWLSSSGDHANQLLFRHRQGKADVEIFLNTLSIIAFWNHTYALANDPCKNYLCSCLTMDISYVLNL